MIWKVLITKTFNEEFRKYEKNKEFLHAMEKKITRLQENPYAVGKFLAGRLHGLRATRLLKNFRLIFRIDDQEQSVFLEAIDHRAHDYKNI